MFSYSEDQKSESQSYIFFANNIFALLRGIITKNNVILMIKFTCPS